MVRTFQLTKVLSKLTVIENMRLGATGQKGETSAARRCSRPLWRGQETANTERADDLLARFKLDKKREDFAGSLSGGQRKLLEMARALMVEPELVMLDEPMAGVNPALTQSLLGHVKSLREEGMTVLFVEHDMDMVRDISDWVIVMAQGKVIAEGPPDSVMGDQRVIDAYLGSHHDADLSEDGGADRAGRGRERSRRAAERGRRDRSRRPAHERDRRGESDRGDDIDAEPTATHRSTREDRRRTSTAAEGAVLRADDLVAGYVPGVNILNGADLYCQEGELVGIIGPNGAGKSTLLKAIFGLVKISTGTVTLRGEDITNRAADRPGHQGHRLRAADQQRLPVADHRGEPADGGLPGPEEVQEALRVRRPTCSRPSATGAAQRAGSLSGGERQMVAMGRALMMEPSVLLLDEPSAGLSPVLQDEVFVQTRQINRAGVSVIMVEQNARRCLQICDRGYVLDQGRNAYTASGKDLANDPKVIELYLGTLAKSIK